MTYFDVGWLDEDFEVTTGPNGRYSNNTINKTNDGNDNGFTNAFEGNWSNPITDSHPKPYPNPYPNRQTRACSKRSRYCHGDV